MQLAPESFDVALAKAEVLEGDLSAFSLTSTVAPAFPGQLQAPAVEPTRPAQPPHRPAQPDWRSQQRQPDRQRDPRPAFPPQRAPQPAPRTAPRQAPDQQTELQKFTEEMQKLQLADEAVQSNTGFAAHVYDYNDDPHTELSAMDTVASCLRTALNDALDRPGLSAESAASLGNCSSALRGLEASILAAERRPLSGARPHQGVERLKGTQEHSLPQPLKLKPGLRSAQQQHQHAGQRPYGQAIRPLWQIR
ncbi:hypothetical protein WJX74_008741 [Apatococcus lobatus]|uniref:Uncharacterized protein n=1 Tax=Apatococcus lobatus TaxID=904363 RepID=A0AAW1Q9C2_9CHLO